MDKKKKFEGYFYKSNIILLSILMIIPGLLKLISSNATASFLRSLGFPLASFFAWILILAEIGSGIAILLRYKLNLIKYIPVIILFVAIFTAHFGDYQAILIRIVLISNYLLLKEK